MPFYSRIPVLGRLLAELFTPSRVSYQRYGDREDRRRRLRAQILALITVVSGVIYLSWLYAALNWSHPIMAVAFIGAEAACFLLFVFAAAGAWRLRFKPEETRLPAEPTSVDVLITTCGEPLHVVERTVRAATQIAWRGPLKVYVLDDTGSAEVEALSTGLGASYRCRRTEGRDTGDTKAGNLNFGLSVSSSEYVLVLDADQVCTTTIVERLAPYLALPKVAFVQSKQSFLVPNDDPFYCQDLVFYNSLQLAFDAGDMTLSCGSGVLYRRAALDDIGGFVTWNLVEDLTTSYELHAKGWKSLYYPYALAQGLAPDNVAGVYRQRGQWALDTMRLFFWRCPLLRRTLTWRARINYAVIALSYMTAGFAAPLFYFIPLWSYASGDAVIEGDVTQFILWRVMYFLTMTLALRWLFRGHQPGKQFQMLVGLFPVYAQNTIRALFYKNRKPVYYVNNASGGRRTAPSWLVLLPQITLLVANAVGPFAAMALNLAPAEVIAANACISALAIWSLSHVCLAAFERKTWQPKTLPAHFYAAHVEY